MEIISISFAVVFFSSVTVGDYLVADFFENRGLKFLSQNRNDMYAE